MKKRTPVPLDHPAFHWVFFILFFLLNAWVSWAPASWALRLGVFSIVFFPLFLFAVKRRDKADAKPLWKMEIFSAIPLWLSGFLLLLALLIRLYKLTTLSLWPEVDEGSLGFYAAQMAQQWHWHFFFGFNYCSPAPVWLLALFFKVLAPSLFSLWLFPVLVSMVTLLLGYAACRQFFSRSLSFLWALGWAFSFWPLYISRFNLLPDFVPLWECLGLFCLGRCLKISATRPLFTWLLMGMVLGSGFYVSYFLWPEVGGMIGLALLFFIPSIRQTGKKGGLSLAAFLPAILMPVPLALIRLELPRETYLPTIWPFHDPFSWASYLANVCSHLTGIFWGLISPVDTFCYKPFWGGFLNPLLGAFFFVGLAEMIRQRRQPWALWTGAASLVFILPVFLTNNVEMFRIIPLMPLVLFSVALGCQAVLLSLVGRGRVYFLLAVGLFSLGLDAYHLGVVYPDFWKSQPALWDQYAKERECYLAYQRLEALSRSRGPGLVLTEFPVPLELDPREQSLVLACHPFDVSRNPGLGMERASWVALLVETPDLPFLRRRFPQAQWEELGPALYRFVPAQPIYYYMAILPITPQNAGMFHRWARADEFLEGMVYESLCPTSVQFRRIIARQMLQNYGLFQGDPFLESHFWTTLSENFQKDGQLEDAWQALKSGLEKGYPFPQKYYYMGFFLFKAGHYHSAREAYSTAARLDAFFTPPPEARKELDRLVKLEKPDPSIPASNPR
jgi:hypothetical protein